MKKIVMVALGGFFAASVAQATTITSGGTNIDPNGLTTSVPLTSVWTMDSLNPHITSYSLTGNWGVITGSSDCEYEAPTYDYGDYLAVGTSGGTSIASVTLDQDYTYFGIYWGSMDWNLTYDVYNTITFYNNGLLVGTYTAAAVASAAGITADSQTSYYVNFFDLPAYDAFTLAGTNYSFEVDNIAFGNSQVPEPATMLLFGTGLAGLMGLARRRLGK